MLAGAAAIDTKWANHSKVDSDRSFRIEDVAVGTSQYESELIASPPATVPNPRQTIASKVLLTNRTEPSTSRPLTPPG